ncbi:hypothetical protein HPB47_010530 [Ixodes persulcatus]|uniref:Uncharacterized protein n=1 Tax=Ixodes persulcatus TaxID=34615 RepID=A0AC60NYU8_IXOPE|nr:hypothetical protein HPB47_010530 [Ixodes persulcatus]
MASSRQDPGYEEQYLRSVKKKKRKAVRELLKSRKTLGEYATIVRQMYEDPDGRVFFECFRMSRARWIPKKIKAGPIEAGPAPCPHHQCLLYPLRSGPPPWNSLPANARRAPDVAEFKDLVRNRDMNV